jgi:hypothetical protein
VLLADCDPAGGDVALRMPAESGEPLDRDRGLLSLAASSRRGLTGDQVLGHVQRVQGGLDVLVGVRSPEQAGASAHLWPSLGSALDAMDGLDVLADCGRLDDEAGTAVQLPVLRSSRLVVFVTRPEAAAVVHLRERVEALSGVLRSRAVDGVPIGVIVVAPPTDRRGADGVRQVLDRDGVPVTYLGQLAHDERGADAFHGRPAGRVDKTLLVRSARELAARLAQGMQPYWTDGDAPAEAARPVAPASGGTS